MSAAKLTGKCIIYLYICLFWIRLDQFRYGAAGWGGGVSGLSCGNLVQTGYVGKI